MRRQCCNFRKVSIFTALAVAAAFPAWCIHPCAQCHPKEVERYAGTPMAHSLGRPTPQPSGRFVHPASKTQFSIESSDCGMLQRLERNGAASEYEPGYSIGSGSHAIAYLVRIGDHLFQSPLCYYSGRGRWNMAPGYEDSEAPDFYRPVTPDCLFCHAGRARPVAGTLNSYRNPPFEVEAIDCERCHGPAEAHLRAPVPGSIINPAKLPPRGRDSVCEQCHLSGEARIPNPGRQLSDFRPGQNLEDVYSVYVFANARDPSRPSALSVISQAQQLALSRCARESRGNLWCGTCHDPHEQPPDPAAYFRSRCLSCHGTALLTSHPKPSEDCIGCHMPRRPVTDGGHTIFTDHRIARRPPPEPNAPANDGRRQSLVAWREPPAALIERNLGLAEIEVGERLKSLPTVLQGDQRLLACLPRFPNDPAVLTSIGQVLLGAGRGAEAAAVFGRVIQIEPNVASDYLHQALAWKAAHNPQKAIECLEKALQRDPLLEQPYRELAEIYSEAQDSAMLRQTYDRYRRAFPKSLEARAAALAESSERLLH
jgi:tetratricopeptide (TPR) repeat protein